jgi:hypothetical protein
MEEEFPYTEFRTLVGHASPVSAFVAAGRGPQGDRGHNNRGGRGGRGPSNKCNGFGILDHLISSCTTSDDILLKWTLAKRKSIVSKYDSPSGTLHAHAALLSDTSHDDSHVHASPDTLTVEECTDVYDDKEASVSFTLVAFSSSLAPGRDLFLFWVVDSACSTNLTFFRGDIVTFDPLSESPRVGGVRVDVKGSGTVQILIPLVSGYIRRTIHALYTTDMSSRYAQRIGRLLDANPQQQRIPFP